MKRNSQTQRIFEFVERNPNCQCSEVSKGTGICKANVASTLNKLYFDCRIRRTGEQGGYRYTAVGPAEPAVKKPKQQPEEKGPFGCANPLTNLFNQRLAEVRGGRRV